MRPADNPLTHRPLYKTLKPLLKNRNSHNAKNMDGQIRWWY